jgi:hypothetical protein
MKEFFKYLVNKLYYNGYKCIVFSLNEIAETSLSKGGGSLHLVLSSGERFPLYSIRAKQLHNMLNMFVREAAGTANTTINRQLQQARIIVSQFGL